MLQISPKSLAFPIFQLVPEGPENIIVHNLEFDTVLVKRKTSKTMFLMVLKQVERAVLCWPPGIAFSLKAHIFVLHSS